MQCNFDITNNEEVVDSLIKGDEATFALIYKSYFTPLRNYAASILADREAAYEIVQNLFVSLWENRKKLDRTRSLRNYLLRGTHNNSLRYLKTHMLHQLHCEQIKQETSEEEEPENRMDRDEPADPEVRLSNLLNELPERSKQVVIMSHIENKKSADIAEELGISPRTVETILYQAMKKLRGKAKN